MKDKRLPMSICVILVKAAMAARRAETESQRLPRQQK
jgi:hypothetical protein